MHTVEKTKINSIVLLIVVMLFATIISSIAYASTEVTPSDNQYLELRATTVEEVEGQGTQVIMELWGHDIDFKRF